MFKGVFECTLDDKNRVVLPAKFRNRLPGGTKLEDGFTLTRGREGRYLELQPTPQWERELLRKRELWPEDDLNVEEYLRYYCGGAEDVELDKSYRFVLPETERTEARIEKEVVFVGVIDKIEIWSKFRYESWREERGRAVTSPPLPPRNGEGQRSAEEGRNIGPGEPGRGTT